MTALRLSAREKHLVGVRWLLDLALSYARSTGLQRPRDGYAQMLIRIPKTVR